MKMPSYAYVPGQTPRHDPELFAHLSETVCAGMTNSELAASKAWKVGLMLLDRGYFWEAHEAFEPVWMAARPNSVEREFVQALIQVSNAALKAQMGRPRAVVRLCRLAESHLETCGGQVEIMGVEVATVRQRLAELVMAHPKHEI